ncbi:MAG: ABC transporter substrate-binding protein, partial [Comamonas sp.]
MNFMTSRRHIAIALTAAAWGISGAVGAATPAQPAQITVQHAKGQATVPLKPQRVVVYDLAALDVMHSLQLPVAGVAKAEYPDYLKSYADARYQAAGSLFIPDFEALSRIRPDLI